MLVQLACHLSLNFIDLAWYPRDIGGHWYMSFHIHCAAQFEWVNTRPFVDSGIQLFPIYNGRLLHLPEKGTVHVFTLGGEGR